MVTLQPSSGKSDTSENRELGETSGAPAKAKPPGKRVPMIAIPIMLSVGLLLAVGYVTVRIVAARRATAVIVTAIEKPAPVVASAAAPVANSPATPASAANPESQPATSSAPRVSNPDASLADPQAPGGPTVAQADPSPSLLSDTGEPMDLIAPQHGERYLQIAAISSRAAQKFLSELSRYHLEANIARGPKDGLVRVVIGPFADRESLARTKAEIQNMWPDCFVRTY